MVESGGEGEGARSRSRVDVGLFKGGLVGEVCEFTFSEDEDL